MPRFRCNLLQVLLLTLMFYPSVTYPAGFKKSKACARFLSAFPSRFDEYPEGFSLAIHERYLRVLWLVTQAAQLRDAAETARILSDRFGTQFKRALKRHGLMGAEQESLQRARDSAVMDLNQAFELIEQLARETRGHKIPTLELSTFLPKRKVHPRTITALADVLEAIALLAEFRASYFRELSKKLPESVLLANPTPLDAILSVPSANMDMPSEWTFTFKQWVDQGYGGIPKFEGWAKDRKIPRALRTFFADYTMFLRYLRSIKMPPDPGFTDHDNPDPAERAKRPGPLTRIMDATERLLSVFEA